MESMWVKMILIRAGLRDWTVLVMDKKMMGTQGM